MNRGKGWFEEKSLGKTVEQGVIRGKNLQGQRKWKEKFLRKKEKKKEEEKLLK